MSLKQKAKKISRFDVINTSLVILITLVILYPLYFCVIASFSEPTDVALGKTLLWVSNFTTDSYKFILDYESVWRGYLNSIVYTVLGTIYNLVLTIPAAYVLSKKYLPFRNVISWYFFLTMYLGGGLIPTYLLMKNLNLLDNPLVMIIGAGVSCYNLIVTRQYFSNSIPEDVYEAARIDGASELKCFTHIALPLAKSIIAVMTLYYGVAHWNGYYNALIYLRNADYYPLQLVLRNVLFDNSSMLSALSGDLSTEIMEYYTRRAQMVSGMKYALIIISSIPMLIAYPFVQKHFTKGIMVGSVKG